MLRVEMSGAGSGPPRWGLLVLLAWAAGLTLPSTARARQDAPAGCEAELSLSGDRHEVAALSRALARYHEDGRSPARCGGWSVTVRRTGPSLTIEIVDRDGLDVVRQVGGADVAAAVIDSWLHRDLHATRRSRVGPDKSPSATTPPQRMQRRESLLALAAAAEPPEAVPLPRPAAPLPSPSATSAPSAPSPPVAPPVAAVPIALTTPAVGALAHAASPARTPGSEARAFRLELGPDAAIGSEGSRWAGAHLGACARLGRTCAGARARGELGAAIVGDPGTTRRTAAAVQATIDMPLAVGAMSLVPGVGVGAGLLRADTTDPGPNAAGEVTGARQSTTWSLRSSVQLVLALPLSGGLGVDVGVSLDAALPARGPVSDGQGGTYPAEPRFLARAGIALRYGMP
jgi:hypothetical protein